MSLFKKLFGIQTIDFNHLLKDGAYIIDVRTSGEFNSGNIIGSTNIPLDNRNICVATMWQEPKEQILI